MRGCIFYLLLSACTNNKCLLGILFFSFSLSFSPLLFSLACSFFFTVCEMPSRTDTLYCMGLLIDDKQRVHKGKESEKKRIVHRTKMRTSTSRRRFSVSPVCICLPMRVLLGRSAARRLDGFLSLVPKRAFASSICTSNRRAHDMTTTVARCHF